MKLVEPDMLWPSAPSAVQAAVQVPGARRGKATPTVAAAGATGASPTTGA